MKTTDLFIIHFGEVPGVSLKHPNIESFFDELTERIALEDQQKQPTMGDRILIKNIPADYPCRDLYLTEGRYMGVIDHANPETKTVAFTTGYTPYLDEGRYSSSGGGYGIATNKIRFIYRAPARFWRFINGEHKAFNGENYELEVNFFECEFEDIKR